MWANTLLDPSGLLNVFRPVTQWATIEVYAVRLHFERHWSMSVCGAL